MEISIKVKDKGIVDLRYTQGGRLKFYKGFQRTYSLHTTCIAYINNTRVAIGTVVKHYRDDNNNLPYAMRFATKKALEAITDKQTRTEIWKKVMEITQSLSKDCV